MSRLKASGREVSVDWLVRQWMDRSPVVVTDTWSDPVPRRATADEGLKIHAVACHERRCSRVVSCRRRALP